ncbi:MAG: type II secretion system F family protein [Leptospirales bacterium]|nr:type II secretion system F family protein [Leptospirales bacterium]
MAIYRYTALNRKGKEEKGIVDAPNPIQARKNLKARGYYVRALAQDTEKKDRDLFPFLTRLLYRVPRRDVALFTRQLGTLVGAGLPLDRSIANIVEQTENEYLKKALIEIRAGIIEGESLSDAMKKHPAIFPAVYHHIVSVGEKTGAYDSALLRLAELEEANLKLRNKITTAFTYPGVMLLMLGGIVVFLLRVVFPVMQRLFTQLDAKLPLITRVFLALSELLGPPYIFLILGMAIVGSYIFYRWKNTPSGSRRWELWKMSPPVTGTLYKKALLARFARNLGVMLENRVPLIPALQVVGEVVDSGIFREEIHTAIDRIKEGARISESFRDSRVVNQMTLGMLAAGEISDSVPQMVARIADVLDNDVDSAVQRLASLLEPLMMVLMGMTILMVMLAMLLPMYNLTSQIRH